MPENQASFLCVKWDNSEFELIGKILDEPQSEETHYQADVQLSNLAQIDILSSSGRTFAIEYSTKDGHNHRIAHYNNIGLIAKHCIEGAPDDCEVRHFTRKIPFIWP